MDKNIDKLPDSEDSVKKERHGCLTAWLMMYLFAYFLIAIFNLFFAKHFTKLLHFPNSKVFTLATGFIAIFSLFFTMQLIRWKKIGFYGYLCCAIILSSLNLMKGSNFAIIFYFLFDIILLYALLQINGKDGITAWEKLE